MNCLRALRLSSSVQTIVKTTEASRKVSIIQAACCLSAKSTSASQRPPPAHLDHFHPKMKVQSKPPSSGVEDMLFYTITDGKEQVPISHFTSALKKTGLHPSDPRLKDCMEKLRRAVKDSVGEVVMDRDLFHRCVGGNIVLLIQAFRKKFIIPEFDVFAQKINEIYKTLQNQSEGKVANYIPQLAKFSPELWGVSLCTVDGQRHSVGDTKQPFCLQSCVKPLQYSIAVHEAGTEEVHRYVGMEPSGLKFNMLSLDDEDKPHNPMVNAGAILISSLIKPRSNKAEKFDYVMEFVKRMAGQEYVGFSNATFQSEKETGDRNFAIGYYMKEKKCFPPGADMIDALDFYFQLCSIEVTCESGSIMAATLANGGICPITGERVLSAEAVRNTLSLMHSCGMYDFSGQMAFHVGLPAKSGVSGAILLVIPNVMGVMCWSPPLDRVGNSVRGIHFFFKVFIMAPDGTKVGNVVWWLEYLVHMFDYTLVKRGAELSTDHHLVVSWIRWQRRKLDRPGRLKRIVRVCWERLAEPSIQGGLQLPSPGRSFSQIPREAGDIESEWTMFFCLHCRHGSSKLWTQGLWCLSWQWQSPEPGGGHRK
ncbi:hypothetical protein L3Q82_007594 [Scortum barcoo]|uniref:Uncharacterized protein n=1 Tax=Scortum barcoo TaxID=214431 RepID=A0ACB8WNW1_9TELE|nr:hypothetical protein L3Q82_007594 [Scortum barcoo]